MRTRGFWAIIPLVAGLAACEDFIDRNGVSGGKGTLTWRTVSPTRADAEIPDTNDFILSVTGPDGSTLYKGAYGDSPVNMEVAPGSYTVRMVSCEFDTPAFSMPQYGDEKVVYVPSGGGARVTLECTLRNCGIRLKRGEEFLKNYPDAVMYARQGTHRLMYSYTEKRTAYFTPGEVSVTMTEGGSEKTLFTRQIAPREILTVNITAPAAAGTSGGFRATVDTSKAWTSMTWDMASGGYGGDGGSGGNDGAISVADAYKHTGEKDIWIHGYIVGGDLSSAGKTVKTSGITKQTHFALASRSSVTDKESCVAVELPSGTIRDALNLVTHPYLIGTRVYVRGDLVESYFGTFGLKGTDDYVLK